MKPKTLFLVITLFIISQSLFAQVKFGVKGGLNFANVSRNMDEKVIPFKIRTKIAYHLGGYMDLRLSNSLTFTPEILYSNRGFNYYVNDSHINLHYLTLPLLINYKPLKFVSIEAGPELAYLLSAGAVVDNERYNMNDIYDQKFDLGIDLGIKFYFLKSFNCGARYNYGLLEIDKFEFRDAVGNSAGTVNFHNRVLQLSIGYTFGKKD